MMIKTKTLLVFFLCLLSAAAFAQGEHATPIREVTMYISPDAASAKLARASRGREMVLLETSRDWLHVEAVLSTPRRDEAFDEDDDENQGRTVTGWVLASGVVRASTPNGDKVLFGEAVDSEDEATRSHGRHGAAQDAMRLYYRVFDLFPNSPLAAEALYRSADIRWQLEKPDIMSRPSAKQQDPMLRGQMDERLMKEVIKKFPGTKWADMAAFHLIDNKLCGDWQGASKCPVKEAGIYEKYASEHPQSPNSTEALYDAASRWAALIQIYKTEDQAKKSEEAKAKAVALAQQAAAQTARLDWSARAQRLLYYLQFDIPTYGNQE